MDLDIVTLALVTGAGVSGTEVVKKATVEVYDKLKSKLLARFGKTNGITKAVEHLEAKPQSEARIAVVKEEVQEAGADKDKDLLELATELLGKNGSYNLSYNVNMTASNSNIVGHNNVVNVRNYKE